MTRKASLCLPEARLSCLCSCLAWARGSWGRWWTGCGSAQPGSTPPASSPGRSGSPADQYPEIERLVLRELLGIEWSSGREHTHFWIMPSRGNCFRASNSLLPACRKTFQHLLCQGMQNNGSGQSSKQLRKLIKLLFNCYVKFAENWKHYHNTLQVLTNYLCVVKSELNLCF